MPQPAQLHNKGKKRAHVERLEGIPEAADCVFSEIRTLADALRVHGRDRGGERVPLKGIPRGV